MMVRLILGLCLLVAVVVEAKPKVKKLSPDQRLKVCCNRRYKEEKVQKACVGYCSYKLIEPMQLANAYLDQACSLPSMYWMLRCAARDVDHSECCAAKGVPADCLQYCRPAQQAPSGSTEYLHCGMFHFDKVKACFVEYEEANPKYVKLGNPKVRS